MEVKERTEGRERERERCRLINGERDYGIVVQFS